MKKLCISEIDGNLETIFLENLLALPRKIVFISVAKNFEAVEVRIIRYLVLESKLWCVA